MAHPRSRAAGRRVLRVVPVRAGMPDPPSYSAVRALLRILVDKNHLQHRADGPRYIYSPTLARQKARARALAQVVDTFFDGSAEKAVAALLGGEGARLTGEQIDRIAEMIAKARKEGGK